jgi:hypothetical protein
MVSPSACKRWTKQQRHSKEMTYAGPPRKKLTEVPLPTLVRFLLVIAVLAGLGFAAMVALATLVQPDIREIIVLIPPDRLPAPKR